MKDTESNDTLLLRGARVVAPEGILTNKAVLVEGDQIRQIVDANTQAAATLNIDGLTLWPGFIDVHIHGAAGVDVMTANQDQLYKVSCLLAESGVTTWLPTLVPAPDGDYRKAVNSIEELMLKQPDLPPAARAVGLHYEGPFVNEQQCGALRKQFFRTFSEPSDLERLAVPSGEGVQKMITLAPEVDGGIELVTELVRRGWIVSIGHTRANIEQLDAARHAGARHMTHFLNAMTPLHHRAPGPIGWGLLHDDVSIDLIADGIHCDPLMIRLVVRCKSSQQVALISDAVSPAGLGDGEYSVWGETITVRDGRTSNERGSIAGSVIMMCDAVRRVLSLGFSEVEAAQMAALNPARLLGLDRICGSIEEGKRADLTALDDDGNVRLTIVGGRVAFES
jgi:N-acetylglucosamine-6-phosphate deacetylase